MSHPLRGDDLLSGIPAARRVLARAPARIYSLRRLAVAGDRYYDYFRKGLSVNHTCKLSRRTSQVSAPPAGTLARLGIFFEESHHGVTVFEQLHFQPRADEVQRVTFGVAQHKSSAGREQLG